MSYEVNNILFVGADFRIRLFRLQIAKKPKKDTIFKKSCTFALENE